MAQKPGTNPLTSTAYWTINKNLAKSLGSNDAALMLTDLVNKHEYFKNKGQLDSEGGFFNTEENLMNDLNLTEWELRKIKPLLQSKGVVRIEKKGMPSKNFFYLNFEVIESITSGKSGEIHQSSAEKSSAQSCEIHGTCGEESSPQVPCQPRTNKNKENKIKVNKNKPNQADSENSKEETPGVRLGFNPGVSYTPIGELLEGSAPAQSDHFSTKVKTPTKENPRSEENIGHCKRLECLINLNRSKSEVEMLNNWLRFLNTPNNYQKGLSELKLRCLENIEASLTRQDREAMIDDEEQLALEYKIKLDDLVRELKTRDYDFIRSKYIEKYGADQFEKANHGDYDLQCMIDSNCPTEEQIASKKAEKEAIEKRYQEELKVSLVAKGLNSDGTPIKRIEPITVAVNTDVKTLVSTWYESVKHLPTYQINSAFDEQVMNDSRFDDPIAFRVMDEILTNKREAVISQAS